MNERPILFTAENVRAILDGRKTQTRRIVKRTDSGRVKLAGSPKNWHLDDPDATQACPYGMVGDRLWVKTRFGAFHAYYRPIAGYEGIYAAGTDGYIYRMDRSEPMPLKGTPTSKGYLCVSLSMKGKIKTHAVHVLMCETFYGSKPVPSMEVRHVDGNKVNNIPDNLDWGTGSDNWSDRKRVKRGIHADHHSAKLMPEHIEVIQGSNLSQRALAKIFSVSQSTINDIRNGKIWVEPAMTVKRNLPAWRPWKSPIFMPRWACRLVLELTEVRVERLQDMSEEDAEAEGCADGMIPYLATPGLRQASAKVVYSRLWESINGAGSWALNPWVWVLTFTTVPHE